MTIATPEKNDGPVSWIIKIFYADGAVEKKLIWNKEGLDSTIQECVGESVDFYMLQHYVLVYNIWGQAEDKGLNKLASKKAERMVYGNVVVAAKELMRSIE